MKKLIVTKKYNGKNLSEFLFKSIPNLSENLFYKTLRKKDIKINNKRISKNVTIYENDEILVYISDNLLKFHINLDIFYEDDNIIILTSYVHEQYANSPYLPMPCHRIDRNTTGLVLFAKNEIAYNILLDKFKKHEIEKHYKEGS